MEFPSVNVRIGAESTYVPGFRTGKVNVTETDDPGASDPVLLVDEA